MSSALASFDDDDDDDDDDDEVHRATDRANTLRFIVLQLLFNNNIGKIIIDGIIKSHSVTLKSRLRVTQGH